MDKMSSYEIGDIVIGVVSIVVTIATVLLGWYSINKSNNQNKELIEENRKINNEQISNNKDSFEKQTLNDFKKDLQKYNQELFEIMFKMNELIYKPENIYKTNDIIENIKNIKNLILKKFNYLGSLRNVSEVVYEISKNKNKILNDRLHYESHLTKKRLKKMFCFDCKKEIIIHEINFENFNILIKKIDDLRAEIHNFLSKNKDYKTFLDYNQNKLPKLIESIETELYSLIKFNSYYIKTNYKNYEIINRISFYRDDCTSGLTSESEIN